MSNSALPAVYADVLAERQRQDAKWGAVRYHTWPEWITILTEEVGETAQEALNAHFNGKPVDDLRAELVQVAAVAACIVEHIDRIAAAMSKDGDK